LSISRLLLRVKADAAGAAKALPRPLASGRLFPGASVGFSIKVPMNLDRASRAVLRVGDGRGFVVPGADESYRYVITAAHCLPWLPPCMSFSKLEECSAYQGLLGRLDGAITVWAECAFVDPIGDIAVLCSPDNLVLSEQAGDYHSLVDSLMPVRVADVQSKDVHGWLLWPDGQWGACQVRHRGGPFWLSEATRGILRGMSGSPIIAENGAAIGVVCTGSSGGSDICTEGGPNPRLSSNLPGWLLRELRLKPSGGPADMAAISRAE